MMRSSFSVGTNTSITLPCASRSWSVSHSPDSVWYEKSGARSPGSTSDGPGSMAVSQSRSPVRESSSAGRVVRITLSDRQGEEVAASRPTASKME
jgi:hypothetical protein